MAVSATGGSVSTITVGGVTYTVHTFTSSGNFTVSSPGTVQYLCVGGGGAGGYTNSYGGGGGGGAGGVVTGNVSVTAQTYSIVVGAGGASSRPTPTSGTNSTALGIFATGGGFGGYAGVAPGNGGSGGGGSGDSTVFGTGTAGQGNNGGAGGTGGGGNQGAGGGGGAGGVGADRSGGTAGAGGIGIQNSINNVATYYAGGGGGGASNSGSNAIGGLGGGGTGGTTVSINGIDGTANTGGGGGGAAHNYSTNTNIGGAGGSGIVIIRYVPFVSLTNTRNFSSLTLNKFSPTTVTPVVAIEGTPPYTYSISPALPEGLFFGTANGAIYGTPTVSTSDSLHTITITDSNVSPQTTSNTVKVSTNLSYNYLVDLVANKTLTITTEYGVADSERRSASIYTVGAQIITTGNVTGNKELRHGQVLTIRSIDDAVHNLGTSTVSITPVDHSFENYLTLGGNLKSIYGNVQASVTGFYLDSTQYTTPGTYTWTVPAGVTSISVVGVGGGGGGSQKSSGGSGGAGGALKYINNVPVTAGDVYNVVVGSGGTTGGSYGATGGDTYMYKSTGNIAPILLASGGRGGDSMYWSDIGTSFVTVYDTPISPTFYTFQAVSPVGGTITYSISSGTMPSGVTLDSSTGVLGGDPATVVSPTSYALTVSASNGTQTITKPFTLVVEPLPPSIIDISPAINSNTQWNFTTQGNLSITTSNVSYTITASYAFEVEFKLWGGGGGGTTDGGIGGGGGYSTGRFTFQPGTSYTLVVGQGGGGVVGNRNAGGGAAGTGLQFTSNSTPIIVAGGGGGGAQTGTGRAGGAGGGSSGAQGAGSGGQGGTQTAAGLGVSGGRRTGANGSGRNGGYGATGTQASRFAYGFGVGGWGSYNGGDAGSGGGGAGYWGGAEGGGDAGGFGGGGGSGYVHPTLITSGTTTAGSGQTPGNNTDTVRISNAGLGGIGGTNGSDAVNSSGFDGLFWIRKV